MVEIWERDPYGAFMRETHVARRGTPGGRLSGLSFAAKDVFDVAGAKTGFGSPEWLAAHAPAERSASLVQRLLDAGADLAGKTVTDELVYSLEGANHHYGAPANPRAPGRLAGGSSSGSAVAVAGRLVDFSVGTDCAGSVRIPASFCGVWGMRPTHGRVPLDGTHPFAPSIDTAGWFARTPEVLARVGEVLTGAPGRGERPARLLVANDAFELAGDEVTAALRGAVDSVAEAIGNSRAVRVLDGDLASVAEIFRPLQGFEVWQSLGAWLEAAKPSLGPGIRERFRWAASVTQADYAAARARREAFRERLHALLGQDAVLCVPSAPGIALPRDAAASSREAFRAKALSLLGIAGLGGLPQISLPLGTLEACPIGVSLIAPAGGDMMLLDFARRSFAGEPGVGPSTA